jgi:hypothetical protein
LAKPTYEATKVGEQKLMIWGEKQKKAFKEIKRALTNAPALGLPDMIKPFFLYVHKRLGTDVGVLTQLLDSWHSPVTYLSRHLDTVSQSCLPCLCTQAATSLLVTEANKLTLGQEFTIQVSTLL